MPVALTVPNEYGYVLMVAAATSVLNTAQGIVVGQFRKAAKVPFPNAYVTHAEADANQAKYLFNCAQRAHANYLENQTSFIVTLLISGLRYPLASAALGVVWLIGRSVYTYGYTRPVRNAGKGRSKGFFWYFAHFALLVMAGMSSWGLVNAGVAI